MSIECIDSIYNILNKPYSQYCTSYIRFNSPTLTATWNEIREQNILRLSNGTFKSEFFKFFWDTMRGLSGLNKPFRTFIDTWFGLCYDHSSRYEKIETCHPVYVRLPTENPENRLKGMTRLYYIASGINNMVTEPNETQNSETTSFIYKAQDSHTLQKTLIKLRDGTSITIKLYAEKHETQGETIFFNKIDPLALAFLQVYAICKSWPKYLKNINEENSDSLKAIDEILNNFNFLLNNFISKDTWNMLLTEAFNFDKGKNYISIYTNLKKIEDELTKINQPDDLISVFAKRWQKETHQTEISRANSAIQLGYNHAQEHMKEYLNYMSDVRRQQKILHNLTLDEQGEQFLIDYFNLFKTIPNTVFHREDQTLYCLYEVPFAHSDYTALHRHIKEIKENTSPKNQTSTNGSVFAEWYFRLISQPNWIKNTIIPEISDSNYWPAFARATKRLLKEVFVDRKTALYISCCLNWNITNSNYTAAGTKPDYFPTPLKNFLSTRVWHPHITFYNCWSAALGEITKALAEHDAQTAFEYTISASGQISFPETAGSKIVPILWGLNHSAGGTNCKTMTEDAKIYQRENSTKRESFKEIITDYVLEELKDLIKPIIKDPVLEKSETIEKETNERLVWLEMNRFHITNDMQIIPEPSTENTLFSINGRTYVFLPSGDFLTLQAYTTYLRLFPTAPKSTPMETTAREPITTTNYINLVYSGGCFHFPDEAELPEEFRILQNFAPGFNRMNDITFLIDHNRHTMIYDTVEDHIFFMENGTSYIVATNILDQVNTDQTRRQHEII